MKRKLPVLFAVLLAGVAVPALALFNGQTGIVRVPGPPGGFCDQLDHGIFAASQGGCDTTLLFGDCRNAGGGYCECYAMVYEQGGVDDPGCAGINALGGVWTLFD